MKRRRVLTTLATLSTAGCAAPTAPCPSIDLSGEAVCPTHDLAVELRLGRSTVALPADLTLTVRNGTGRPVTLLDEGVPFVYRREPSGWTGPHSDRRPVAREGVTVTDRYTYTERISPYGQNPKPGDHLVVVPANIETGDGGERRINLIARFYAET